MIQLTGEQRMLVDEWERIARQEFAQDAYTWDGETPWENLELLADRGYLGVNLPEEYGGGGLSEFEVALQIDAIGQVCPDTMNALREQSMNAPRTIAMFGSEAVKEQYLPIVTGGEALIVIAISEPGAGSDVMAMNTTLEQDDDGEYYLNGEKTWVSHVPEAAAAVVWTKTEDGSLGSVVMDMDAPGVEVSEHYTNMANHAQSHFFMEDVHIPEENVLVKGDGFKNQLRALNWERMGVSLGLTTMATAAFEAALEYTQDREQFGQAIADFQGIQWKLADMAKEIEASKMLNQRAILNANENDRPPERLETSLAALYSSEIAERVVSEAVNLHGATGYMKGHPVEYLYRYVKGRRIGGGTDEVQKNNIARELLENGLPSGLSD